MKRIASLLLSFVLSVVATAQVREFMLIEKTDGDTLEINLKDIQRFFFEQRPVVISPEVGGVKAEPVDLGLSVKWSSWNFSASSPSEKGKMFYPGDVVGDMDKEMARALQLPWNYCGSEHDIATANWGDEWRLPNATDWEELFEKCTWEIVRDIDYKGMVENPYFDYILKATGPNGNSITFLLSTDGDYGSGTWPTMSFHCSGIDYYMCGNNSLSAQCGAGWSFYYNADTGEIDDETIYEHISNDFSGVYKFEPYDFSYYVRPVMGESTRELLKLTNTLYLKTNTYISCRFSMDGHHAYKNVGERGICYSSTIEQPTRENSETVVLDYGQYDTIFGPLAGQTTYYVRTYATLDGETFYSETKTITTGEELPTFTDVTEGELIDLGLHVKWASCNLGATSPEDEGTTVSWPDSVRKEWGVTIEQICASEQDYARNELGGEWRMPTYGELKELKDSCVWTLGHCNGTLGYKVTGKNGNSIFVPRNLRLRSGTCEDGTVQYVSIDDGSKSYIRPVQGNFYTPVSIRASYAHRGIWSGDPDYHSIRVEVSAQGLEGAKTERCLGVCYSTSPDVIFSEANFIEVESPIINRAYKVKINNLDESTTYYYRGVAIIDGETYYSKKGQTTTSSVPSYEYPGKIAEAIDLGLSVKWSSWNFSASSPSEKGGRYNLFATLRDFTGFASPGGTPDILAYNMHEEPTLYENVTESDEDLVDYIWGCGWRIPTKDEWQELIDKCTWEEATVDGTKGYKVTGTNGNSIFLPYCGSSDVYRDDNIYDDNIYTHYWSATKYHYDNDPNGGSAEFYYLHMYNMSKGKETMNYGSDFRCFMWIRPVKE